MKLIIIRTILLLTVGLLLLGWRGPGPGRHGRTGEEGPESGGQHDQPAIQANINFGLDPYGRTQGILNIQPVLPIRLGENWNLITRTIVPVIYQPDTWADSGSTGGLGDVRLPSSFRRPSPAR